MTGTASEGFGVGKFAEGTFSGHVENDITSTSSSYSDTDNDDDGDFVII